MTAADHRPVLAAGAVAVDDRGRLLVVQRGLPPGAGRWTVPGGRVERGERLADAAVREVAEETGLAVVVRGVVGIFEIIRDDVHLVSVDHRVEVVGGRLRAGDDARDVRWMARADLARVPTTDGLLEFLDAHGVAVR